MTTPPEMPVTIPAFAHGGPQNSVSRVVLHDEEYPVGATSAEDIGHFFASAGPGTSAHYVVDSGHVEHCVAEHTVAYHAPPNQGSIGIEHDGYSRFTASDWAQPGSVAALKRSAILTAGICLRWGIPVAYVDTAGLLAGKKGITFHRNVSEAFHQSTHTDPGENFPIKQYIAWVQEATAAYKGQPTGKSPLLTRGMTGSKVADVQRVLDKLAPKNRTAAIDGKGVFGPRTQQILEVFQGHRGIHVSGTVDPITWAALRAVAHPKKV